MEAERGRWIRPPTARWGPRRGHSLKVLIDKKEGGHFVGRTEIDSVEVDNEVLIDAAAHYCRVGDFVQAKVVDATEFDLYATVEE